MFEKSKQIAASTASTSLLSLVIFSNFSGISGRGVPEDHVGGGHVGPGAICRSAASLGAAEPLLPATGAGVRSGAQLLGGSYGDFNGDFPWGLCGEMEFHGISMVSGLW